MNEINAGDFLDEAKSLIGRAGPVTAELAAQLAIAGALVALADRLDAILAHGINDSAIHATLQEY